MVEASNYNLREDMLREIREGRVKHISTEGPSCAGACGMGCYRGMCCAPPLGFDMTPPTGLGLLAQAAAELDSGYNVESDCSDEWSQITDDSPSRPASRRAPYTSTYFLRSHKEQHETNE